MRSHRLRVFFRDYLETLFVAFFIAIIIRLFILTAYKIPTSSMLPTLQAGDFVFAYRLPYGIQIPLTSKRILQNTDVKRGEVIVFRYPGDDALSFIKRVAAIDGDKVEIKNRRLYINDVPSIYEKAELSESRYDELVGMEYYSILKEKIEGSTRLVMFRKGSEGQNFGPEVVPPGHIFVLGDNRDSSDDSRYWGMIPQDRVDGRIVAIWLSLDWHQRWAGGQLPKVRWNRTMVSVH